MRMFHWAAVGMASIASGCVTQSPPAAESGIAVIELFTSEGCSSCPPADEAIAELAALHRGERVFVLAFHVDYWNSLGWKDPFSDPTFTERQQRYARTMHSTQLYTPQAVVNGRREFVGSDRNQLDVAVKQALAESGPDFTSVAARRDGDLLTVTIDAAALPQGSAVFTAVVQDGISVNVTAGENGGRTLRHDRVVRSFVTGVTDNRGTASLQLTTPAVDFEKSSLVVVAQAASDLKVLAAREIAVPK